MRLIELRDQAFAEQLREQNTLLYAIVAHAKASSLVKPLVSQRRFTMTEAFASQNS
jgi:hypothetical protein